MSSTQCYPESLPRASQRAGCLTPCTPVFRVHPPAQVYGISFPAVTMHRSDVQVKLQADDSRVGLAPETFYHLHPFHFVVDMDLRLIQAGSALSRLVPELATPGCLVSDYLQVSPDSRTFMQNCQPM